MARTRTRRHCCDRYPEKVACQHFARPDPFDRVHGAVPYLRVVYRRSVCAGVVDALGASRRGTEGRGVEVIKVIWDNGVPACLPRWARDEMVALRLRNVDLQSRCVELRQLLAEERGEGGGFNAALEELNRNKLARY